MQADRFRVLVVSGNERFRSVLPALLSREHKLVYQGSVVKPDDVLDCIEREMPDVVISDAPPANVADILTWRKIRELGTRLVMLTRYMNEVIETRAVLAGAAGLILVPESRLAGAVERVAEGASLHSREVEGRLRAVISGEAPSALSRDERQVFGLVYDGHSDSEIAMELGTSPEIVQRHIASIAEKLS